ncbi:MAG: dockerin [Fibrobacter sp.]|nr:dockerin [Fibrobacter sp.]
MKSDKIFTAITVLSTFISAGIISSDRMTIWDPGVPGRIIVNESSSINVLSYGADSSGQADSKDAITKAIEALGADGGIVYLPAGKYLINSTITIGKNNIVLRGDGHDKTKLFHNHTGLAFDVIKYNRGTWQNLVSGFQKGSSTVVVQDGSKFTVGAFAEIQQSNDSSLMYTSPDWIVDWAQYAVGQLFEVKQVNGNSITFRTPLHFEVRSDLNPQIRPQGFVCGVGFEKFYIERMQGENSTFQFKNAAYCWIRNIESSRTQKSHITNNTTLGCEYRDSYFHHSFNYGGGGSGYGVEIGLHSTDCLCENNVFDSLRHAMIIHLGATGCVYGYNYSINPVQGEGETNLNVGWNPPDISLHGHFAQMNLFEGNVVQEVGIADHWGPMGPGNTFLRNVVESEGVYINDHSHSQNLVGNTTTKWVDDGTSKNTLRHGENVNSNLIWDAQITDHDIPVSYYLESKPAFFGSLQWPSTGSDLQGNTIPARKRWESGQIVKSSKTTASPKTVSGALTGNIQGSFRYFDLHGRLKASVKSVNQVPPLSTGIYLLEKGKGQINKTFRSRDGVNRGNGQKQR